MNFEPCLQKINLMDPRLKYKAETTQLQEENTEEK